MEEFLVNQKYAHKLKKNGYANLVCITRCIFKYAKWRKYVDFRIDDVIDNIDWAKNAFNNNRKDDAEEVFTYAELSMLIDYFIERHTVRHLGLLLCIATGMRVGELAALSWEDIDGMTIHVNKTESSWYKDGKRICEIVQRTKTDAGTRHIPLPSQVAWVIDELRKLNPDGKYVFEYKGRRITIKSFEHTLYRSCDSVGIPRRSPHKLRKTYASILLDNNISEKFIIENMGHTSITTTKSCYARNRKDQTQREEIISSVPEFDLLKKPNPTVANL